MGVSDGERITPNPMSKRVAGRMTTPSGCRSLRLRKVQEKRAMMIQPPESEFS